MLNKSLFWLACALLFLPLLPAQQPPGHDALADALFPPELVMSNQKAIGLSDAQRDVLRGELLKAQSRFTELQWRLQDAMEALLTLLKQTPVDEAQVMSQLDKVLNSEREVKRTQIGLLVRIKNNLTAEQQGRLQKLKGESK